jgi:hypothetical protein
MGTMPVIKEENTMKKFASQALTVVAVAAVALLVSIPAQAAGKSGPKQKVEKQYEERSGTLESINSSTLVMKSGEATKTFDIAGNCKFGSAEKLEDKKYSDFKKGDEITVLYLERKSGRLVAHVVYGGTPKKADK